MDQLKKIFGSLSTNQIIGTLAAVLLVAGGLFSFVHWNKERGFKPLFTGMAPEDAATIVQKLKESGVEYRIDSNGSSVLVPEAKVDELRLEMAGAGLPKTGRIGFELFDRTNLGITDFTEKVNYRRALEGELERSIKGLTAVEQARVHLTFPKDSVFLDSREAAKASVLISTKGRNRLPAQNVQAIVNLVASAVEGLSPEAVSVLDMQGNLLNRPHEAEDGTQPSQAALEYKHQIEKDLVAKVQSTLEPLLGESRFRVGVTADCDFTTSEQSEETLDPTKSVMVTTQKSEDLLGQAANNGVPGTQSNLPRAVPRAVGGSGVNSSRKSEGASFETSKTIRHVKTPQGSVKRLSASLLLDQDMHWEGKGKTLKRVIVPPTPEKIKAINDVVAGVLGLQPERGDKLIVESLPFEQTLSSEAPVEPKAPEKPKDLMTQVKDPKILMGAGGGALLVIVLVFLMFSKSKAKAKAKAKALEQASLAEAQAAAAKSLTAGEAAIAALEAKTASSDLDSRMQLPPMTKKLEGLRDHIKASVRKEPEIAAEVLRGWLTER